MIENLPRFIRQNSKHAVICQEIGLDVEVSAIDHEQTVHRTVIPMELSSMRVRQMLQDFDRKIDRANTDYHLQDAWDKLADVPIDEDECIEDDLWISIPHWDTGGVEFDKGAPRDAIWGFFDTYHSKGVAWLMGFGRVE